MILLNHVRAKRYGLAIWLNLLAGLRVGEVQSLRCGDIDLDQKKILVSSTYVRKENRIQNHPKGKEDHYVKMPPDLALFVSEAMQGKNSDTFVSSGSNKMIQYNAYLKALKNYCRECGVKEIATHGLRHSTSEVYLAHGATRDDLFHLFAHSSLTVTERYMHDKGEKAGKIADLITCLVNPAGVAIKS